MMHTVVHDQARRLSRRKPGYNDPEVRGHRNIDARQRFLTLLTEPPRVREKIHWDARYILTFSPVSAHKAVRRRGAAEVVTIILPLKYDVPAVWVRDGGPVAHDPVSLAL